MRLDEHRDSGRDYLMIFLTENDIKKIESGKIVSIPEFGIAGRDIRLNVRKENA